MIREVVTDTLCGFTTSETKLSAQMEQITRLLPAPSASAAQLQSTAPQLLHLPSFHQPPVTHTCQALNDIPVAIFFFGAPWYLTQQPNPKISPVQALL